MSGFPWYKHDPLAFLDGTMGMTLEETGAYIKVLDLIYMRGTPIQDDAGWIASYCCCSARQWLKVRASLLAKGKLYEISYNGLPCLMNRRAADDIAERERLSKKFSEGGSRGGQKTQAARKENNDLGQATPKAVGKPGSSDKDRDREEDKPPDPPRGGQPALDLDGGSSPDPIKAAFDAYNELAVELNLPVAQDLTETRRKKLKARLARDPKRWTAALQAVRESAFLRGERKPDFRASLDFLLQESSFQKVVEGFYGRDGPPTPAPDPYNYSPY